jgi:hypothetical protein
MFDDMAKSLMSYSRGRLKRYLRFNENTTDYGDIPNVNMIADVVIEFDINAPSQNDNIAIGFRNTSSLNELSIGSGTIENNRKLRVSCTALPLVDSRTSMDVFNDIFHRIRFEYTFSTTSFRILVDGVEGIAETDIGFNFSTSDLITLWKRPTIGDNMEGIISNLKIYDAGTLIRYWPINSNSGTEADEVSGSVMTFVNGTADQWGLFTELDTVWKGTDLEVPPWESTNQELAK